MRTIKTLRARPRCFAKIYDLTEAEMAANCLGCRSFGDCIKWSRSPVENTPPSLVIPMEAAADHEYGRVRW